MEDSDDTLFMPHLTEAKIALRATLLSGGFGENNLIARLDRRDGKVTSHSPEGTVTLSFASRIPAAYSKKTSMSHRGAENLAKKLRKLNFNAKPDQGRDRTNLSSPFAILPPDGSKLMSN
jgi:hypothetical protein